MKKIVLQVTSAYTLPSNIDKLTPESTELFLNAIGSIILDGNNFDKQDIEESIKQRYENNIKHEQKQHKESINRLEMELVKDKEQINTLNKELERQKQSNQHLIDTTIKDTIEKLTTQQQLTETLNKDMFNNRIEGLNSTIKELNTYILDMKLRYEKIINDLETKLFDQHDSFNKKYTETIEQELKQRINIATESKNIIIDELKQQIKDIGLTYQEQSKALQKHDEEKYTMMIQQLKIQLDKQEQLINEKTEEHTILQTTIDKITEQSKQQLIDIGLTYQEQNKALQKHDEEKYTMMIQQLKEQLDKQEQLINKKTDDTILQTTIDKLTEQLQPIIRFHNGTNEEKGTAGEQSIVRILQTTSRYESAIITDTSGETARGDIYFYWKHLKCLIEVKNKKTLTLQDIEKFIRDIKDTIESSRQINCALFISLQTDLFPGRSREPIQFDIIEDIPVIYIHMNNPEMIHYAIACLDNIVKFSNNKTDDNDKLRNYFKGYYKTVHGLYGYFNTMIKRHETEIRSIRKEMNILADVEESMTPYFNQLTIETEQEYINGDANANINIDVEPIVEPIVELKEEKTIDNPIILLLDTEENIEISKHQIIDYYINLSINNTTNDRITVPHIIEKFNISSHTLHKYFGGFKNIVEEAQEKYLSFVITDDIINKLQNYKASNNQYPKRPVLTKHYIPERTLTKIGKVLGGGRVMEKIYNYIDARLGIERTSDSGSEQEQESEPSVTKKFILKRPS
jgi:hypothetical protein